MRSIEPLLAHELRALRIAGDPLYTSDGQAAEHTGTPFTLTFTPAGVAICGTTP
jgi:hypothetical protein